MKRISLILLSVGALLLAAPASADVQLRLDNQTYINLTGIHYGPTSRVMNIQTDFDLVCNATNATTGLRISLGGRTFGVSELKLSRAGNRLIIDATSQNGNVTCQYLDLIHRDRFDA